LKQEKIEKNGETPLGDFSSGQGAEIAAVAKHASFSSHVKGRPVDDYYRKLPGRYGSNGSILIQDERTIEAIVSVRILKDGTALVQKVEKSSGNALFDRSALKALAKASPLAPPPYEMEIGVRFYP